MNRKVIDFIKIFEMINYERGGGVGMKTEEI
jgi:hypothetical protein